MQNKRYANRCIEKTLNAIKIGLVLKMLSKEEERYFKKNRHILNNLPHFVVRISYIKL